MTDDRGLMADDLQGILARSSVIGHPDAKRRAATTIVGAITEERPMALLEVRGLEKWYGRRQVVNGVDFDVNRGEVVGLLGPNGAGKTTSFRMTTGQLEPNDGHVWFNGEEVT